ncbi:MAG: divergent polysaccharide deacetylase family protein [Pseudomonadota bacterium]
MNGVDDQLDDSSHNPRAPSTARVVLTVAIGAALFVGLATLFASLLRPFAPARAALDQEVTKAVPETLAPGPLVADHAPPIARLSQEEADELRAQVTPEPDDPRPAVPALLPAPELADGPHLAIILTELGPDAATSRRAIAELPAAISFTFSPYAGVSPDLAKTAKADGHEVFVSVPMQPQRYPRISPGPDTLLVDASSADNLARLDKALAGFPPLDGITGMMGSAFTQDRAALGPVMAALADRDLVYIDARASARSVAEAVARGADVPSRSNDRFIDEPATRANIETNLAALIRTAKRRGHAIGYARPVPATIDALSDFEARAAAEGVTLIGAARLARGLDDEG